MKVVYIAGPLRGPTPWAIEQNVRVAEDVALKVSKAGAVPLCPHTMYRFYQNSRPDDYWLEATLELLRRCDGIVMLPGWKDSKGSVGEYYLAQKRKMRSFEWTEYDSSKFVLEEIREWVDQLGSPTPVPGKPHSEPWVGC